jgi:acylphosphatase
MAEEKKERLHALVEGVVQGVGYRFFVTLFAEELQLTGWVRNLWDGRVEVMAEGSRPALEILLKQLQEGPHNAQVTKVDLQWQTATNEFKNFRVPPSLYKLSEEL